MGGWPSPVRQRVAVPSFGGSNPSPPLSLKILVEYHSMKFNLLLHDEEFLPRKSKLDHKSKFEEVMHSDLKSEYKLLNKLIKD